MLAALLLLLVRGLLVNSECTSHLVNHTGFHAHHESSLPIWSCYYYYYCCCYSIASTILCSNKWNRVNDNDQQHGD